MSQQISQQQQQQQQQQQTLYDLLYTSLKLTPGSVIQLNDTELPDYKFTLTVEELLQDSAYDNEVRALFSIIPATLLTSGPDPQFAKRGITTAIEIQLISLLQQIISSSSLQEEDPHTFGKYETLLKSPDALELIQQFSEYLLTDRLKFQELQSVVTCIDRASTVVNNKFIADDLYLSPHAQAYSSAISSPPSTLSLLSLSQLPINLHPSGLFTELSPEKFPKIQEFIYMAKAIHQKHPDPINNLEVENLELTAALLSMCPAMLSVKYTPNIKPLESPFNTYSKRNPRKHPDIHEKCYNFFYMYTRITTNPDNPDERNHIPELYFVYSYDLATILSYHKGLYLSDRMIGKSTLYRCSLDDLLNSFLVKDLNDPLQKRKKQTFLDSIFWK